MDLQYVPDLPVHAEPALRLPLLVSLSRVLSAGTGPLIYFFDQAEAVAAQGPTATAKALEVIINFLDASANAAAVVAWENTQYSLYLETAPDFLASRFANGLIAQLKGERNQGEIREIIGTRLRFALKRAGIKPDPGNPLFPLPENWPAEHERQPTRRVLQLARERAELELGETIAPGAPPDELEVIDIRWKEFFDSSPPGPEGDEELLDLLAWACNTAKFEGVLVQRGEVTLRGGLASIDLKIDGSAEGGATRLFALSGAMQGGRMLARVNAAINRKEQQRAVAVRLDAFPNNPSSQTAQQLLELLSPNGVRVRPTPEELRVLAAYRQFVAREAGTLGLADWALQVRVLESSSPVRIIVFGPTPAPRADVRPQRTGSEAYYKDPSGTTATSQHATQNGAKQLVVGVDANGAAVALDPEALTRHTAVLGSTGSGKTTLILSFVEQLAMLGVPSILVDRKGDFAAYANDSCWSAPLAKGAGRAPETITQSS
jgi:hypothetical protein